MNEEKRSLDDLLAHLDEKAAELNKLHQELGNKEAEFKMLLKTNFGITDGERASVLDLVKCIKKIKDA